MGHSHDHAHHDHGQFYLEQLLTIGVCAAFGGVTVILWASDTLKNLLDAKFHGWVLAGGVALIVLSAVNGVAVWLAAGKEKATGEHDHHHDHNHDHDHAQGHGHSHEHAHDHNHCDHHHHDNSHCDHDHEHSHAHGHDHVHVHGNGHGHVHASEKAPAEAAVQTGAALALAGTAAIPSPNPAPAAAVAPAPHNGEGHGHGHGHDGHNHGLAPWRFAVLLLPVAIYFVVPLGSLIAGDAPTQANSSSARSGGKVADVPTKINFQQLTYAALFAENRAAYDGKTVQLIGQYVPQDSRSFTLRRYKISCCAADAVGLDAVILIDPDAQFKNLTLDGERLRGRWVQITGWVQFLPRSDGNGVVTTLILTPNEHWSLTPTGDHPDALVKEVAPPGNPYLN
ncbi:MAG TPA: hypothetical protein VMS17_20840 [Gemmataceae bacterium]|nr:hypothetical protein [Gemmataceae bacterium]